MMRAPSSLRGRMLLVSVVATVAALVLAGIVVAGLFGRFVVEGLDRRLDAELTLLASTVDDAGRVDRTRLAARIGAFEAGPAWQWRIAGPDGSIGSRDFPALAAVPPLPPGPPLPGPAGIRPLDGRASDGGQIHARRLLIETSRGTVTITAAAPREVLRNPILAALTPLLATLAGLGALLTLAMLVQLRVGLRPLARMQQQVAAIRAGSRARIDEDQPAELAPLARELNAFAADSEAALASARLSAANLAHALKTPVATLALTLEGQPDAKAEVAWIDRTIRHHLARARADAVDRRKATPLRAAADDIAFALRALHRERSPAILLDVADDLDVAVEAQDLAEILGNLMDNAARHASSRISVTARRDGRVVALEIADNGPGIPATARIAALSPGQRLDERGDGHGFGLSIAAELVALYGGEIALGEATGGGLEVRLTMPAALFG